MATLHAPSSALDASTKTVRAAAASRARLRTERGAALVEALIVISFLILGFLALSFFRELYTRQLIAARLARASTIAHAIGACVRNDPAQWLGRRDLARFTATKPGDEQQNAVDTSATGSASASNTGEASTILSRVGGTSGGGQGILNPMTTTNVAGSVRAETREPGPNGSRLTFRNNVRSRSFVSCGERVRDGEFGDVVDYVRGTIL